MPIYWKVNFMACNDISNDTLSNDNEPQVMLEGDITVKANNIFEALELAKQKIKTFGYERMVLNGGKIWNDDK